jgi:hypothetical protein
VRECLLDNDIDISIAVYVNCRDRQIRLVRFEDEFFVQIGSRVKLNPEPALTVEATTLEKHGAIRSMIVIEVRCDQPLSRQLARETAVCPKTRNCAADPILGPESGRDDTKCNQRDSKNKNASLHRFQPMLCMLKDFRNDCMKSGAGGRQGYLVGRACTDANLANVTRNHTANQDGAKMKSP